jgi:hypothetical protein
MLSIGDAVRVGVNAYDRTSGEEAFYGKAGTVIEYDRANFIYIVTLDESVDGEHEWPFYESELDVETMATWKS